MTSRILHLFYLHFLSSNNPLRNSTNNKIPFFPFIFQKDFFGFILILCLYLLQTHFGISSFSHPDNALEVCGLLTPLHIVPEWYFLCQYAMLKEVHGSWNLGTTYNGIWVSGGHYVYNPTLKRFFLFHFQFPFLLCGFRILHLFYLHFLSSNNPFTIKEVSLRN